MRLRFKSAIFDCAEWRLLMPISHSDAFESNNAFELLLLVCALPNTTRRGGGESPLGNTIVKHLSATFVNIS